MTLDDLTQSAQKLVDLMREHSMSIDDRHVAMSPNGCTQEVATQLKERIGIPVVLDARIPQGRIMLRHNDELTSDSEIKAQIMSVLNNDELMNKASNSLGQFNGLVSGLKDEDE